MGIIRDANSAAIDKAMALAWVFHLVGDVHQPLHTSALFTTQFPNGDQGGNLIFIRTRANANTTRLHSFWDGLVITTRAFRQVRDKANELRSRVSHRRAALRELTERDFHDWSQAESFPAARIHAYRMRHDPRRPRRDTRRGVACELHVHRQAACGAANDTCGLQARGYIERNIRLKGESAIIKTLINTQSALRMISRFPIIPLTWR